MSIANDIELANTQTKLARLEKRYEALRNDTTGTPHEAHVREVTMRSLRATINQFSEEIARYQARQPARR